MNTVFSVDDLTDTFWPPPAPAPASGNGMTRSQSEWAFQRLLEEISVSAGSPISSTSATDNAIGRSPPQLQSEPSVSRSEEAASDIADVVEIQKPQNDRRLARSQNPAPSSSVEIDPNHYQAILKSKLDLACAAVALRKYSFLEDSSASSGIQKQPPPLGSQAQGPSQNKPDNQVRQATSGSTRDDSDDEDLDGDTETTENGDVKRARRRSRRRKQEQMKELDTQVGQLRAEHSTLLKRLTDMNQKYDTAAVDNRILKADIETLRTKVKMAEESVKRVTGMHPLVLARPNSIPLNSTPTDSNHSLKAAITKVTGTFPNQRLENKTVVPLNMNPVSITGSKSSTKVGFPQNVALPNHSPKQVNPFLPTSCDAFENWDLAERKNKPQE